MSSARLSLVKLLTELGLVDNPPHESLIESRNECPLLLLSKLGQISEAEALQKLSKHLGIEQWDLDAPARSSQFQHRELVRRCNSEMLWSRKVLPLIEDEDKVIIAVANPLDFDSIRRLQFDFSKPVRPVLVEETKLTRLLGQCSHIANVDFDSLDSMDENDGVEILPGATRLKEPDQISIETPPVIKLCNKIIADAIKSRASDIHVEPVGHGVEVRFRIDGVMNNILEIPKRLQSYATSRFKLLAGMDIAERRRPQDGRIRVKVEGEGIDLRVSCLPTSFGEKIVMRVLRTNQAEARFSNLGIPKPIEDRLFQILQSREKVFLVTGPTGSGKTTTLYTAINYLNNGTANIETVEDPVEYRIAGVNQVQTNESIGVTFATALRSILRQDPDVIMIGEIRDSETAKIALQAAQTGHLVLSTLHTNDAPAAITRLTDLGVEPYTIAAGLGGVLAQRLVRKLCEGCKGHARKDTLDRFTKTFAAWSIPPEAVLEGSGCRSCGGSGYRGRHGIYSYLQINEEIVDLIHRRAPASEIVTAARKIGYVELPDAAAELLRSGVTSFDEVRPFLPETGPERRGRPSEKVQSAAPSPEPAPTSPQPPSSGLLERPKILLVDDDEDIRVVLSTLLEREMYEVIEAKNGAEALQKLYEVRPTVILCDLMMPEMDGKEFLVRLRGNKQTKDIPLIFLTAVATEANEVALLDLGANDFISKVASPSVMLSRIRRMVAAG